LYEKPENTKWPNHAENVCDDHIRSNEVKTRYGVMHTRYKSAEFRKKKFDLELEFENFEKVLVTGIR
jgi:hypothetical protein